MTKWQELIRWLRRHANLSAGEGIPEQLLTLIMWLTALALLPIDGILAAVKMSRHIGEGAQGAITPGLPAFSMMVVTTLGIIFGASALEARARRLFSEGASPWLLLPALVVGTLLTTAISLIVGYTLSLMDIGAGANFLIAGILLIWTGSMAAICKTPAAAYASKRRKK
jgi:hypothetical protein